MSLSFEAEDTPLTHDPYLAAGAVERDNSKNKKLASRTCIVGGLIFLAAAYSCIYFAVTPSATAATGDESLALLKHRHTQCKNEKNLNYSSETAKTVYEIPFAGLAKDNKGMKVFEASGIASVKDDSTGETHYYVVHDSSWAISKIGSNFAQFSGDNVLIGDPKREEAESEYEAVFHLNNTFYVVRESIRHETIDGQLKPTNKSKYATHPPELNGKNHTFHAIVEELVIVGDDYKIMDQCRCEFEFDGTSKGFEGAAGMVGADGELYMLGLCEGNFCAEIGWFERGNGRLVLMKKTVDYPTKCLWETVKMIDIPSSANFADYSDITISPNGKAAITSQVDSAVWIGQMQGIQNGVLNPDTVGFDENQDHHETYYFPLSEKCHAIYCNVEGIALINDDMFVAVSDQMKKGGKQDFWCLDKDQSVHTFILP